MHVALNRSIFVLGAIAASLGLSQRALAQSYSIAWFTIDSGGGRVTGASGYALEGTIGQFDVGVSTSGPLQVQWGFWPGTVPRCRGDYNTDGSVTSQDFFDFLSAFFGSPPAADFNHDGQTNSQDFFDFLAAFFTGC